MIFKKLLQNTAYSLTVFYSSTVVSSNFRIMLVGVVAIFFIALREVLFLFLIHCVTTRWIKLQRSALRGRRFELPTPHDFVKKIILDSYSLNNP